MTQETTIDVQKAYWWTQNKRGDWRAKYRRTSVVKRCAYLTYRSLINSGKLKPPAKWPVHVTAIIHPLTHGRFDPENAAPMVKAILDAITQADFWPDDNARYVVGPDYRLGEPSTEKGVYHITIRIEEEGHEMSAYQPVLDPACGGRMFWFDKSDDRVLFGDVRDESWELCDGRRFDVKPDMLMDYRDLPFPDGTFRMVVLDPPHLRNAGETSYMAQKYGCLDQETWKADLKTMFSECFRVLKEHGVLIFKWNETQIPVSQILKLTAHKPLFGNKQPNRTGTHWIVFMKEDAK